MALAQVLGSVPIVSAVGGLREQVDHDRTGLLLPPGAGVSEWIEALRHLEESERRREMGALARHQRLRDHRRFRESLLELTGTTSPAGDLSEEDARVERLVASSAGG